MMKKLCPECDEYSFTAYTGAKWICPKCGSDITSVPYDPPHSLEDIIIKTEPKKNPLRKRAAGNK